MRRLPTNVPTVDSLSAFVTFALHKHWLCSEHHAAAETWPSWCRNIWASALRPCLCARKEGRREGRMKEGRREWREEGANEEREGGSEGGRKEGREGGEKG